MLIGARNVSDGEEKLVDLLLVQNVTEDVYFSRIWLQVIGEVREAGPRNLEPDLQVEEAVVARDKLVVFLFLIEAVHDGPERDQLFLDFESLLLAGVVHLLLDYRAGVVPAVASIKYLVIRGTIILIICLLYDLRLEPILQRYELRDGQRRQLFFTRGGLRLRWRRDHVGILFLHAEEVQIFLRFCIYLLALSLLQLRLLSRVGWSSILQTL